MENGLSVDERNANLALLAQAAAIEHKLKPFPAMCTYWRTFLWCNFICAQCVGALLWGCNAQHTNSESSISSIGSMFGGLSFGWISDRFGRRGAIVIASVVSIVGVLIQLSGMLLVGRLVNGFALGMFVSCASVYCIEVSPLALRGITPVVVHLWIILGQIISNGVYAHKLPFALRWMFPIILLAGLPFAPESPWWLVRNGQHAAAERVLAHLGVPTVDVMFHRQKIQETFELEDSYIATSTYIDCFRGENLKRTVVAIMVFVLQQCAGMAFVLQSGTYSFRPAGFVVDMTPVGVIVNLLAFGTVHRFRRRSLFNWGTIACGVILLLTGIILPLSTNRGVTWTVFIFIMIHEYIYHASIGPAGNILFAEVSSAKLRSKTVGIGICTNSLCGMLTNTIVSYLDAASASDDLRRVYFSANVSAFFGCLTLAVGGYFTCFFIPETKGRTVDELDLLYEKRVPAMRFASYRLYRDGELV